MSRNRGGDTFAAVSVEIVGRSRVKKISRRGLKRSARRILEILGQGRAELSLALVDNREMQKLNARYRDKNEPTDVLAFPAGKALLPDMQVLGDVVISVDRAGEQARRAGKTLEQEMEKLLIHGILHLLGYDHERSRREARVMRGMEKKVSRALERFVRSRF